MDCFGIRPVSNGAVLKVWPCSCRLYLGMAVVEATRPPSEQPAAGTPASSEAKRDVDGASWGLAVQPSTPSQAPLGGGLLPADDKTPLGAGKTETPVLGASATAAALPRDDAQPTTPAAQYYLEVLGGARPGMSLSSLIATTAHWVSGPCCAVRQGFSI
jgi:hypothetical protein